MCGLVGWLGSDRPGDLSPALDRLHARGPDGRGQWRGQGVALGHTRLSMVAPTDGAQPFVFDDVVVLVNGELYGDAALRHRVIADGARFATGSDSELIVHLYRRHGVDLVHHLEGEWAFLLWDRRQRRLLAARDPLGIRPLYWHHGPEGLRIASSLEALWALGVPCSWSPEGVRQVLSHQYLLPGHTLFERVHALPPGGRLLFEDRPEVERWWTLPLPAPESHADPVGALQEALQQAVHDRLRGDARIGVQLSGGIDSAVVASLSEGAPAFTVAFTDHDHYNELAQASAIARHLGCEHHVLPLDQRTLLDALPTALQRAGGLPINLHGAARMLLAEHARSKGITGWMSGEGADELFFGYAHLRADLAASRAEVMDPNRLEPTSAGVHTLHGAGVDTSAIRAVLGHVPAFLEAKAAFCARLAPLVSPSLRGSLSLTPLAESLVQACPAGPPTHQSAWLWTELCLCNSILSQLVDPMELAHGVEGRLPFLDRRVIALAMSMPDGLKVRDHVEKWVLRQAAVGLPDAIRHRRKQPFMAPPLQITDTVRQLFAELPRPAWLTEEVRGLPDEVAPRSGADRTAADAGLILLLSAMWLQEAWCP